MRGIVLHPLPLSLPFPWKPTSSSFALHHPKTPFNLSIHASSSPTPSPSSSSPPTQELLTARERRRLRNSRRENNAYNWKEEVEEKFIKKKKKEKKSWTEQLNLDNLADLGPQWWVVRVSRVKAHYSADLLARSLARNFPDREFKVYIPSVNEKKRLKNGSLSEKPKPLFPGCIFLRCVLNKELHDFIREVDGIGGFLGSRVGSIKRQINRPRPVADEDIKTVFRQAKEEQEKADQAFEEQEHGAVQNSGIPNTELEPDDVSDAAVESKPKRRSRKTSDQLSVPVSKLFVPGSTVRVLSGTFSGFTGTLKKLNRKTKMATVHFTLFGKENIADIDVSEMVPETN
ncbi:hypothetical protein PIB30_001731 [Stylosanthes scabra]|uniref:NusG-like N-terminal domain-containing protein n=1 Tax=Stylosanthes scabra TaxID=79078 RepID=A0ABU6V331_9FABA|nr:hypothetical protein [Stylosanthes scabra]